MLSLLDGSSAAASTGSSSFDSLLSELEGNSGSSSSATAAASGSTTSLDSQWAQILQNDPQAASEVTTASLNQSLINSLL